MQYCEIKHYGQRDAPPTDLGQFELIAPFSDGVERYIGCNGREFRPLLSEVPLTLGIYRAGSTYR
jgi:hypothetical protein